MEDQDLDAKTQVRAERAGSSPRAQETRAQDAEQKQRDQEMASEPAEQQVDEQQQQQEEAAATRQPKLEPQEVAAPGEPASSAPEAHERPQDAKLEFTSSIALADGEDDEIRQLKLSLIAKEREVAELKHRLSTRMQLRLPDPFAVATSPSPPTTSGPQLSFTGHQQSLAAAAMTMSSSTTTSTSTSTTSANAFGLQQQQQPPAHQLAHTVSDEKLQEILRLNVEKHMNENLNTSTISRCVRELLSTHNIGQRLFAKYVLGLSQGTVSELLSKPKPWDKLTEKGRDSYRKMHAWAADETCIQVLKSMVLRRGGACPGGQPPIGPTVHHQQQQAAAAAAAAAAAINSSSQFGEQLSSLLAAAAAAQQQQHQSGSHQPSGESQPDPDQQAAASAIMQQLMQSCFSSLNPNASAMGAAMAAALAKSQQQQHQRAPSSSDDSSANTNSNHQQVFAGGQSNHQHHNDDSSSSMGSELSEHATPPSAHSLHDAHQQLLAAAAMAAAAAAASGQSGQNQQDQQQGALHALGQHHQHQHHHQLASSLGHPTSLTQSSAANTHLSSSSASSTTSSSVANTLLGAAQTPAGLVGSALGEGANELAAASSPLQRMQSITNSLLSQSSLPPIQAPQQRSTKAVLPPITQQQFDAYSNLHTEDIVKKVKDQLSQYSISQRLFGESVLGLSQGSVSDLLARPKPWHMLTQKGREPFIRMKMFLEDENAVHKLVASQYKIAPEKLMRSGGFMAGAAAAAAAGFGPGGPTSSSTGPLGHAGSSGIATNPMLGGSFGAAMSQANLLSSLGGASPSLGQAAGGLVGSLGSLAAVSQANLSSLSQSAHHAAQQQQHLNSIAQLNHQLGLNHSATVNQLRHHQLAAAVAQQQHQQQQHPNPLGHLSPATMAAALSLQQKQQQQHQNSGNNLSPYLASLAAAQSVSSLGAAGNSPAQQSGGLNPQTAPQLLHLLASLSQAASSQQQDAGSPSADPNMTALKSMREALLSVADILDLSPTTSALGGTGTINTATNSFLSSLAAAAVSANQTTNPQDSRHSADPSQLGAGADKFPASLAHLSQSAHPFLGQQQRRGALSSYSSSLDGHKLIGGSQKDCLSNNPDSPLSGASSVRGDGDLDTERMDAEDDADELAEHEAGLEVKTEHNGCRLSQQPGGGGYNSMMSPASSSSSTSSRSSRLTGSSSPSHLLDSRNNNLGGSNDNGNNSLFAQNSAVYEMAALTADLDTPTITTRIKETLMAHNLGQKIFGEVVLGLSQGSVSELLSKPKPWHMLSIKGREPFIRMHLWLNDKSNIDKLQSLKNERKEAKRIKR